MGEYQVDHLARSIMGNFWDAKSLGLVVLDQSWRRLIEEGTVPPTAVFVRGENTFILTFGTTCFATEESTKSVQNIISGMAAQKYIDGVAVVLPWLHESIETPVIDSVEAYKEAMEQEPGAREMLMIRSEWRGGDRWHFNRFYSRDKDGKIVTGVDDVDGKGYAKHIEATGMFSSIMEE